jgi:hypothetical protein
MNKGGKTAMNTALDQYYFAVSQLYGEHRLLPAQQEFPHMISVLREPPGLSVQPEVKKALNLHIKDYDYRKACRKLVTDPWQVTLTFMLSRNLLHGVSADIKGKYSTFSVWDTLAIMSEDARILEASADRLIEIRDEYINDITFMLHDENARKFLSFPIEFIHDRCQLSTMVYQTKYFMGLLGISAEQSIDLIYRGHLFLEERGYLDQFNGHIVVLDYEDTPIDKMNKEHILDSEDQHEQRVTRYDEMILYSKVVEYLRAHNVPVYVVENGKGHNTIPEFGFTVSNLLSGLARGMNPSDGFQIKLPQNNPFGDKGMRDLELGEISVKGGQLSWEKRKWYEDVPLSS